MTSGTIEAPACAADAQEGGVRLADGSRQGLGGLTLEELQQLQWEQEQLFARAIQAAPKGSPERTAAIGHAYDTVCTILTAQARRRDPQASGLVMGLDRRYVRLVLETLQRQRRCGFERPSLFEVGYGSGLLLAQVAAAGYPVGGIEISRTMRDQAVERLGAEHADALLLGSLRDADPQPPTGRPTLVYWNDVFEHIPTDEIDDYLRDIHRVLDPRGWLITITPNWLLRPSDVTVDFCPPRTAARGLHLKEYRLGEVTRLLRRNGFRRVVTPLCSTRARIHLAGDGGRAVKESVEAWIDRLPLKWARLLCRGLAMSCTIAMK